MHWLHRDLFDWKPERRYGLWHDRAVFHFLIEEDEREDYLQVVLSPVS